MRLLAPPTCCLPNGSAAIDPPTPRALLPGSFNPLHDGHRQLAEVAAARLGCAVHFELSATNVDKSDLPADEVRRRVRQFAEVGPVWVTRAARFVEKAELFPGVAFVLGFDTAVRLIDPKYYGGEAERDAALNALAEFGCRVIVGGRVDGDGVFRVWDDTCGRLPARLDNLFEVLSEAEFRVDVSSTALRRKGRAAAASEAEA